jgi:Mce-associated membrane protein
MAEHVDPAHQGVNDAESPADSSPEEQDATSPPNPTSAHDVADDAEDYDSAAAAEDDQGSEDVAPGRKPTSPARLATIVGLLALVSLVVLAGWLEFRAYQLRQAQQQRELWVQVGRQGALNLTTIDWQHADADVRRVLDSATGDFYRDFSQRSKPFIDVLQKAQSKSTGTVTEAGLEMQSGDEAQVLVAVSVDTSNLGAAQQEPRFWRMRITVQRVGTEAKVSNVQFVP